MNVLDGVIVFIALTSIVRGIQLGLVRQVCSGLGFFGGLFIGIWAESKLIHLAHTNGTRTALAVGVILGCAFLLLIVGEYIGDVLKFRLSSSRVDRFDKFLGSLAAFAIVTAAVWLGINTFASFPSHAWQQQVQGSRIVTKLNSNLPAAPNILARIGRVISPNGFPKVFNGIEPKIAPQTVAQPELGVLAGAVSKDKVSVVKIEGRGCGGTVEGSGFVANTNTVVTNAHVVAGVPSPEIIDDNGKHSTSVIWFDADLDVAVLRSKNLAGKPLNVQTTAVPSGTATAALGYPEGGGFTATPASVIDSFDAIGQNIYNAKNVTRNIYSLNAAIRPGNSGGPLIDTSGTVVGLVFARSARYNDVGYALTMRKVMSALSQAERQAKIVSTGDCTE